MTEIMTDQSRCGRIADYLPLIQTADGLTLSQVCSICKLESTTIQNWIKRGYVPHPVGKKYLGRHLARILLISELREGLQIEAVGELLRYINGDTDDESDDIITEERLYDVYHELTEQLDGFRFEHERVGDIASQIVGSIPELSEPDKKKITNALLVMVNVYAASCYKREAQKLFINMIKGVQHG
ncbi:MAG: DUF1836 domain-containing protein [Ruminococcus sp.]|nr:DUF1836 domain-containing protein [Ruminococcus sp.]